MFRSSLTGFLFLVWCFACIGCTEQYEYVPRPTATPTFTPIAGTYVGTQSVTISDSTPNAVIYYTINGSTPTTSSAVFSAPITVATSETITAIALAPGYTTSAIASANYIIQIIQQPIAATPVFSPTPGSYPSTINVTITDATPGASIYYTTGRVTPTTSSTQYTGALIVNATTTFEAIATVPGYQQSAVAEAIYTITPGADQWTWMAGTQTINDPSVYGTTNVPAALNTPSGRSGPATMSSGNGTFWLFGGYVSNQFHDDLWRFDTASNQWTWVSGSNTGNDPGSYGVKGTPGGTPQSRFETMGWTDKNGNPWIFGGTVATVSGTENHLNDLWKFDIATQQWTWVTGSNISDQAAVTGTQGVPSSSVTPGNLTDAAACSDASGNFYLFGGNDAVSQTDFDDLWQFNPSTLQWTWLSGNGNSSAPGVYGTQGVASTQNSPGGRSFASCWADASGHIWIFGGLGVDSKGRSNGIGTLNDLWQFNPSNSTWTWISGSKTSGSLGTFGTQDVEAAGNIPSARYATASWIDINGNLWLFGGYAFQPSASISLMNDLWRFNPSKGEWTWMTGSQASGAPGVYGTLGVPSLLNTPGARTSTAAWVNQDHTFWLFGLIAPSGFVSDMWRYQP